MGRIRAIAVAVSGCALVAACSSTGHPAASKPSSASGGTAQQYLTAVNALCDGLAQKIDALNGGQFDIPLKAFRAQLPQHTKLLSNFDRQLAAISVPQAAAAKAKAFATYVTFANKLDAARQKAAQRGAAAYQREINTEKQTAASDPSIAGLTTAGFSQSCQAR